MKRILVVVLILTSLSVYSQQFQPEGKRLSLAFVHDDDTWVLILDANHGGVIVDPKGFSETPESPILRTMEFDGGGVLRFSQRSGRIKQYVYAKAGEDMITFERDSGDYIIMNEDRDWYRAIDSGGEEIYLRFYYDAMSSLHVHIIQLIPGGRLRTNVYRALEVEEL